MRDSIVIFGVGLMATAEEVLTRQKSLIFGETSVADTH
jgi:hypothetical protein